MSMRSDGSIRLYECADLYNKANSHECKYLPKKAGYTLTSSNRFALIIRCATENKIYDIYKANELLENDGCSRFSYRLAIGLLP